MCIGLFLYDSQMFLMRVLRTSAWCMAVFASAGAYATEYKVDLIQFEPWAMLNPDTTAKVLYVGIVPDLLDEFERRSGHTTTRILTPYIRVEINLQRGISDFSLMAWGPARALYANRGTAFVPLQFGIRAHKDVSIKSYADLASITTSVPRGLRVDPRFDVDTTLSKDDVLDYTMGINKTALRRDSQAVAGSLSTINNIIEKLKLQSEFGDTIILNTTHFTVAYSKKSIHIEDEEAVNAVFKTMVTDGTAKRIYDKWIKKN
jgi:polar amino acid transport system substrate-binding protein